MPNIALVTGASAGIGKELARYHASKGGDVILTARREAALAALKAELESEYNITAFIFALDLSAGQNAKELYDAVTAAGLKVEVLINNAGFGGQGLHTDRALEDEHAMVDLNVKALMTLTHEFGRDMAARGSGRILNVGSTAGFVPGPMQTVYFATKAFVNSYSQAIDQELRPKGVTCTLLAPGYVETEFADVADLKGTKLAAQNGATAASVAKFGYDAMMKGQLVAINQRSLSIMMQWITPLMPRRMVLKMLENMQVKAS